MNPPIFQKASESQRKAAHNNVFPVWPHSPDRSTHVNLRMASIQHNYADWYVALDQDVVIGSLAAYPFKLSHRGKSEGCVGVGAVHTIESHRGRGVASSLLRYMLKEVQRQGFESSLLHSDVGAKIYENLGYHTVAEHFHIVDVNAKCEAKAYDCVAFVPKEELEFLDSSYHAYAEQFETYINRDHKHWQWCLTKSKNQKGWKFLHQGSAVGYAIGSDFEGHFRFDEVVFAGAFEAKQVLKSLQSILQSLGLNRCVAWHLPPGVSDHLESRKKELTMLNFFDDREFNSDKINFTTLDYV